MGKTNKYKFREYRCLDIVWKDVSFYVGFINEGFFLYRVSV